MYTASVVHAISTMLGVQHHTTPSILEHIEIVIQCCTRNILTLILLAFPRRGGPRLISSHGHEACYEAMDFRAKSERDLSLSDGGVAPIGLIGPG